MKQLIKRVLLALAAVSACSVCAEESPNAKHLDIGIVPYMSVRVLIEKYEPVRTFLEQALGTPIKIYTANGFKPFYVNTERGDFDLVITAAHFARLLQNEHHFTPLVRFSTPGRALLMAGINSPLKSVEELRGRVIAVPDKLSLASIACMTYLRENKLIAETDFKLIEVPSFPSAILSVQNGDAAAACTAQAPLSQMPKNIQDSVRPLADAGDFLNLVVLASPRVKKSYLPKLSQTLLKLNDDPNGGQKFISALGFGPLIPAVSKDMNDLERYISETKRLLHETP